METTSFQSGGARIGIHFQRSAMPAAPGLLLLHGAGGVEGGERYLRQIAEALAQAGYSTFIVEYFHRTQTEHASLKEMQEHFELWLETITHAMDFICDQGLADPGKLGAVGYSLGGYLAVAQASRDLRLRAVVEFAGGIDSLFAQEVRRLPPLLIIHGDEDLRVPFLKALELANFARSLGTPVETDFYPGERHVLSAPATQRALANALAFLSKHLG